MIESFKYKPDAYKERIDRIISLLSFDEDRTRQGLDILQGLVSEVENIAGE